MIAEYNSLGTRLIHVVTDWRSVLVVEGEIAP